MKPRGGLLVDQTPQGNDGVPGASSGLERTILGDFRRYLPNSGVMGSALGAANAFALGDVTVSFWLRTDLGAANSFYPMNYFSAVTDAWGLLVLGGTSLRISDDIDNAGAQLYATVIPQGKLIHCVGVLDSLENLLYVDGALAGSGIFASDDWASFAGTLYHGSRLPATSVFEGIIGPLHIFNTAKDQAAITTEYLKGARAVQFKTDWGVRQSIGDEVANARVGMNSSPYEIISGRWQMAMADIEDTEDVKVMATQAGGAGAVGVPTSIFECTPTEAAYGGYRCWSYKSADANVWNWMPVASDFDVPAGATQDGYLLTIDANEAVQLQTITNGGVANTIINSGAAYVAIGTWYEFWLTRRYDGFWSLYIRGGAFANWTLVGTGAENTHTTASYQIHDNDPGDMVGYSDRRGDHCSCKMLGAFAP